MFTIFVCWSYSDPVSVSAQVKDTNERYEKGKCKGRDAKSSVSQFDAFNFDTRTYSRWKSDLVVDNQQTLALDELRFHPP